MSKNIEQRSEGRKADPQRAHVAEREPLWQWGIGAAGGVLVLATLAYMAYESIAIRETLPQIALEVETVNKSGHGFLAMVVVSNSGGSTAAQLRVEATLMRDGRAIETGELTFPYVPARSHRRGGLYLTQEPGPGELKLRAVSFLEP
jgi:uncharacterized protein (TIGR02588 family)